MLIPWLQRLLGRSNGEVRTRSVMWDAAGRGNRVANWNISPLSANAWMDNPSLLRARAEGEFRNNPWGRKVVSCLVEAAWGATALNPQFRDRSTQEAWERFAGWWWSPRGALALQTVIVSGECFVLLSIDPDLGGVPLRLTVLGPEYLDTSRVDGQTYAGIRYAGNKVVGYWLHPQNPGLAGIQPSVFVEADNVLHLFQPIAAGAQRGQSWLAPILLPLRELNEYLESALVKAKVAALFAGYVRSSNGNPLMTDSNSVPVLEPGSMVKLGPDEDVSFSNPPDIESSFDPFVKSQLRRVAAGMGIPYEALSTDLSQVTFASGRAGLLEFKRHVEAIQFGLMVPQYCEPILRKWARIAEVLGLIEQLPGRVRWCGPGIEMLDPRAETLATVNRIRAGLMSRSEAILQTGWRAEDVDAEIAADNARADGLNLTLDSDPRRVSQMGQQQTNNEGVSNAA